MIDKDTQVRVERDLLDQRIQDLEALVLGAQKALFESELKVHATMLKLLTSNDVNKDAVGWDGRRTNILENMNILRREIIAFFRNEGIVTNASYSDGRQPNSVH